MAVLQDGIRVLIENGLVPLVVFALVFVIVFGLLRKTRFLVSGDDKAALDKLRPVHTILSLVMGALVIIPYLTNPGSRYDVVTIIAQALPQISYVLLAVLGALILLGFFGMSLGRHSEDSNVFKMLTFLLAVGFIIWVFGSQLGWRGFRLPYFLTGDLIAVIIAVLVFGVVIAYVMGPSKKKKPDEKKIMNQMRDFIKGKK